MANTNTDALYPEFWFAAFDPLLMGEYGLQNQVSRDTQNLIGRMGDTVNVPITPDMGDANDWTPGDAISPTAITQQTAQVILNKSKSQNFALTGTELALPAYDLIEKYGVSLFKSLLRAVNLDLYMELMKTQYYVDALSSLNEDKIVDAKKQLDLNEVSMDNRILLVGPDDTATLLKLDAFQHSNIAGDSSAIREGMLQRKFGFDIKQNNIISKFTPSDVTGAVNLVAGYSSGVSTIVVDGFADSTRPVRAGDMFTISGESGTPYHFVTSTTKTAGVTTGISFTPALTASIANDDVITVTPSRSLVGFTPDAVAFAARAYPELPAGVGVRSTIGNFMGIPVRVSVFHDGKLGVVVQADILYGSKLVNEKRSVAIKAA